MLQSTSFIIRERVKEKKNDECFLTEHLTWMLVLTNQPSKHAPFFGTRININSINQNGCKQLKLDYSCHETYESKFKAFLPRYRRVVSHTNQHVCLEPCFAFLGNVYPTRDSAFSKREAILLSRRDRKVIYKYLIQISISSALLFSLIILNI